LKFHLENTLTKLKVKYTSQASTLTFVRYQWKLTSDK
jgi:hypothetical protein